MSAAEFVAKWKPYQGKETAGYISHFDDLCRLLGHETPAAADPAQSFFCFQKAVQKDTGRPGFADVFYRLHFGWEYKGNHRDLDAAYKQLLQYRENLENPQLLIVSDFQQVIIRTNFNNTVTRAYHIELDDLLTDVPLAGTQWTALEILRLAFLDPAALNPGLKPEELTEDAALRFGELADILRGVKHPERRRDKPHTDDQIARFLTRIIFCLFASDAGLLPKGIVSRIVEGFRNNTLELVGQFSALFRVMNTGGPFGTDPIYHFNGGLFSDDEALPLWSDEVDALLRADELDWSSIEPSIFGTLFERILDPRRRQQIGAHYTSREDIETLVKPVLMAPLEREWEAIEKEVGGLNLLRTGPGTVERREKARELLQGFIDKLGAIRVLDPACGSGNFLYVSLALLKGLEQKAIAAGATWNVRGLTPKVHPRQLAGIEIDPYAHELASMVVWIGYLQWKHKNGIPPESETPILDPLSRIQLMDAILDLSDPDAPREPEWPDADVIVGNPPFLGGKLLRTNLGDAYVDSLFKVWDGRVRREADLCCYWHEKARAAIEAGRAKRAGLLATQGIRGGANRETLRRIKASGDIFFAESDRPWVLEGAAVHVSMVGFDDGSEDAVVLDGKRVSAINADLTHSLDLTRTLHLRENAGISFMGDTKGGAFDIDPATARRLLAAPNPDGRPNSDVVRAWANGEDITGHPRGWYIIDFPPHTSHSEAALYEAAFEWVQTNVAETRSTSRSTQKSWWIHERPRPAMRLALGGLSRFIATPNLTKHRLFVWLPAGTLPDHQLIAFARDDDYFFGVLHSKVHDCWARAMGTQLREVESGFRYTPTTCFETFPLPWPPGKEPPEDQRVKAIAEAAAELDRLRNGWLHPPGDVEDEILKRRTLTNLYNERPTWLDNAHRKLDEAVFAAYGWPADLSREEVLERLLVLNTERSAST
jgi:type II restriction/modification system DNA methylase subunit YeeA